MTPGTLMKIAWLDTELMDALAGGNVEGFRAAMERVSLRHPDTDRVIDALVDSVKVWREHNSDFITGLQKQVAEFCESTEKRFANEG